MPDYLHSPGIAMPTPAHTLTPAAEHARQAVRDFAARRKAEKTAPPELVTRHKPVWTAIQPHELPTAAAGFFREARARGRKAVAFGAGKAVEVRVDDGRIRAWWVDGKTGGALVAGKKANATQARAAL